MLYYARCTIKRPFFVQKINEKKNCEQIFVRDENINQLSKT